VCAELLQLLIIVPSVTVERLAHLLCNRKVLNTILGMELGYPD
jgi:hypothetical protein